MKIVKFRPNPPRYPLSLHNVSVGDCVEFERVFHQKHAADAKFLVLRVPAEYIVVDRRYDNGHYRIMVANLETGEASLVTNDRKVRFIDAEVVLK